MLLDCWAPLKIQCCFSNSVYYSKNTWALGHFFLFAWFFPTFHGILSKIRHGPNHSFGGQPARDRPIVEGSPWGFIKFAPSWDHKVSDETMVPHEVFPSFPIHLMLSGPQIIIFLPKWAINNRYFQTWVSAIFRIRPISHHFKSQHQKWFPGSPIPHGQKHSSPRSSSGRSSAVAFSRAAQQMPWPLPFRWIWGSIRGCRASVPSQPSPASLMVLGPWGQRWGSISWECSVRLGWLGRSEIWLFGVLLNFGEFLEVFEVTYSTKTTSNWVLSPCTVTSTQDIYGWKSVFLFLLICLASAFVLSLLRLFKVPPLCSLRESNLTKDTMDIPQFSAKNRGKWSSDGFGHEGFSISFLYQWLEGKCWPRMKTLPGYSQVQYPQFQWSAFGWILPSQIDCSFGLKVCPPKFHAWDVQNNMISKRKRACNIFFDPTHFQEQTVHTYCFVWFTSHFCHVAKYNSRPIKCPKTLVPAKWQERTAWFFLLKLPILLKRWGHRLDDIFLFSTKWPRKLAIFFQVWFFYGRWF